MNLHEVPDTYRDIVEETAIQLGIPPAYVEKDYWLTQGLKHLHASEYKDAVVFKGGTALSKAHHVIRRFSEDIDLALRLDETLGDSRRKRLLKLIEKTVSQDLHYREKHPQESKHGRFRKTAYGFPIQTDASELGEVADTILLEINSFANPEPCSAVPVTSLVHDFLDRTGRSDVIDEYHLEPFDLLVLSVERTLCEKLMALVRSGHESDPVSDFRARVRHFYDVVMIMRDTRYQRFVESDGFFPMLERVRTSDRLSMPKAGNWLDPQLTEATVFAGLENLWDSIDSQFRKSLSRLVPYGEKLPERDEVLSTFARIGDALRNHG